MGLPSASLLLEGSKTLRNAADVAAEANTDNFNGYAGKRAGGWSGTSFAAPRWAGYLAPTIRCTRESHAGLVNPTIYSLGLGSGYATDFHDISSGSNSRDSAEKGYDLVTGWGSPNGAGLINALAP